MEPVSIVNQFKEFGVASVLVFSAIGSCLGVMAAGLSAVGAWKKGFVKNKPTPFIPLLAFIGAPLSQTFYGMILMNKIAEVVSKGGGDYLWLIGGFAGVVIGLSAAIQGKIGAAAADAMGESDKGFTNYIAAMGIIESVAIFVMVFSLQVIKKLVGI
ncbi:MAG: V-type ATP synthase subunit K [Candidatus Omnitrophica bacterium]|nr:V-type ATP synthase subunit K [Candidatus Omnitrophota bacterium]